MASIIPFEFEQRKIRVVMDDCGNPWWVAKDVCSILDIVDYDQAIERLDTDERGGYSIPTPGGPQVTNCVNESGLYTLILGSRKPEAKQFKRWITHEVLPSLRKTGRYSMPGSQEVPKTLTPIAKEFFLALRVAKSAGLPKKQTGFCANALARSVTGCDLYALMGIDEAEPWGLAKPEAAFDPGLAGSFFSALNALSPKIFSTVAEMRNGRLFIRMQPVLAAVAANGEPFHKRDLYPALKKHPAFQQSNVAYRWSGSPTERKAGNAIKVWAFDLGVLSGKPERRPESEKVVPLVPKSEDGE